MKSQTSIALKKVIAVVAGIVLVALALTELLAGHGPVNVHRARISPQTKLATGSPMPTATPAQIEQFFTRLARQIQLSGSKSFAKVQVVGPVSFVDAAEFPQHRGRETEFIMGVSGAPRGTVIQLIADCKNGATDISWASADVEFPPAAKETRHAENFALRLSRAFIGAVEMQNRAAPKIANHLAQMTFVRHFNDFATQLPRGSEVVYKDGREQFNAESDVDGKNYDISMTYFWNADIK